MALLEHAPGWFDLVVLDDESDFDALLHQYARHAGAAADLHLRIVTALEAVSFAGVEPYPALLDEQRGSARFLAAEAALFSALADGELDDEDGDETEGDDEAPSEAGVEAPLAERAKPRYGPVFDRRVPNRDQHRSSATHRDELLVLQVGPPSAFA